MTNGEESVVEVDARASRRRRVLVVSVVAAVLLIGLLVWLAQRGDGAPNPEAGATSGAGAAPSTTTGEVAGTPDPSTAPSGTTTVPAPTDVPSSAAPVPIDDTAVVLPDLSVRLERLDAVDGEAVAPGDVAGPAVRVTVTVQNDTGASVSLASAVVNAAYGDDLVPALPLPGPDAAAFPPEVGAGESGSGVFVFGVPTSERSALQVSFDYTAGVPIIVFEGAGPS